MELGADQALAWRLRRQELINPAGLDAVALADRLCGVQAQVPSAAELAVRIRQVKPAPGEITRALITDRTLVRMWAARGTLHLLPAGLAPSFVAAVGALRFWEKGSWQRGHGITAEELTRVLAALAEVLDHRLLSREDLVAEVLDRVGSARLAEPLGSGWGALFKPAAYLGLLCHGPAEGNRVTFTSPAHWLPGWTVPDPEQAGQDLVRAYLRAFGPAGHDEFAQWLFRNGKPGLTKRWFAAVRPELTEVSVAGKPGFVLTQDLAELRQTKPSKAVRLVPAFDQYVVAVSRDLIPKQHLSKVSRAAGWISPVVLHGGRVAGVWRRDNGVISTELFAELPVRALSAEIERVGALC
ncbi:winged helix DNA-binding domain-containing protein [Crossiella sp. CA198]|uniref:winged helix DNA-binding domain-containing protein n=1 Tax=Crossiella sp. CA198 TaxID=3455607 RepID=UPI003F8CF95B